MATITEALAIALQHHQAGQLEAAEQIYRQILQVEPNHADAIHLLGLIAHQVGKHEIAVEYIERAIELNGTDAAFHNNLGEAYRGIRRIPAAVACYRRALELKPDYAEAYFKLGNASYHLGKLDEAVTCYRRALGLNYVGACINLGVALLDQGKPDEAVACYRRGLEMKPDFVEAYNNLGFMLLGEGKLDEAVACYSRALELKPDSAGVHNNLGNALKQQGKLNDAITCYRRALELEPDFASAHSNLLFTLQYRTGITLAELAEAHARYDDQHAKSLPRTMAQNNVIRSGQDRLMLGFVSPDLWRHPVGRYLVRVLENLRQEQCETVCYSDRLINDDLTCRLKAAATQWRDVTGMSDEQLAEQIQEDRIDILFDLSGHSAGNRLLVFARKAAPIQITWIGYEGTTGLATMDYLLADRYMVPEGSQQHYREHVLQMPDGYLCYDPPASAPSVGPLAVLKNRYVTFGGFSNPAKITPEVVAVWAEILRRIPTARLIFKYLGLGDESVQRRYLDLFAKHDVAPQRLEFLPFSSYAEYLAAYHQVDVALDPFPFSGNATTCDALWMGVPVITCPGETFASRHGLSQLANIGLTECIARDPDHYVELAVELASDVPRLANIRSRLREQMAASPLCDGPRFAKNFSKLLHDVWQQRWGKTEME